MRLHLPITRNRACEQQQQQQLGLITAAKDSLIIRLGGGVVQDKLCLSYSC